VNPRLVVEQAMESVLPLGSLKGVTLSARIGPECAEVVLDPDRLHQVIWNLLANAIRFTGEGGTVQLRVSQVEGRLKLEVQDTGEGIEPSVLPYVFRRFAPADSATSRRLGGLGMGLAMMKHLVDLQGGTIEASSAGVGQGSTFTVMLPTPSVAEQAPALGTGKRSVPSLAGRTVLVVEDETDTRDLLKAVLQSTAAKVVTASDGVDALKQMQGNNVDLVVSDLGMPERDGYDLIRLIRLAEGSGAHLPAVALTARTREEDRSRALAAGFDVHLAKPVDPRKLVNLVASLLAATAPPQPGELRN
jgi:CheY-like chemotaxis protein